MTATYYQVHFSRMDDNRKHVAKVQTREQAQKVADRMGREGWVLKDIIEKDLTANVYYIGKTYFEESHGLAAKRAWRIAFADGDIDHASTKKAALEIAKARTSLITAGTR